MAEIKLYTCDLCETTNAIRLSIPSVQTGAPDYKGDCEELPGVIDLCPKCLPKQISHAIENLSWKDPMGPRETRRYFWKELFKK